MAIVNSGSSRNQPTMHLFIAASLCELSTYSGLTADALSRDNLPCFRACCPQAEPQGTPVPPEILDVLLLREPDESDGLDGVVEFYYSQALADFTKGSYKSSNKDSFHFCTTYNVTLLPTCEQSLCLYAASLANEGQHLNTIFQLSATYKWRMQLQ